MPTSFEIIDGLMNGRPVPRMGLRDNIWPQTLEKWLTQGYPTNEDGKPVDTVEHFAHDWVGVGGGIDRQPVRGVREVLEETEEWSVVRDGSGAALKRWKKKAGTPEHIDFLMINREVWERDYRPHVLEVDPDRLGDVDAAREAIRKRRAQGKYTLFGGAFVFEIMRQSMGDLCMYESFVADPEWVRDFCRVYTDFFIGHYKLWFEKCELPDAVRLCEDLGYKNGLFCSPASLQDLVFPFYKEIIDFLHSHGLKVILHACGGLTEAVPMVVEAGFDAIDPLEVAAGCNLVEFARRSDNRLVFSGGFDKRILESGDRGAIKKEIVALTQAVRDHGIRYVFSIDHSISTNADYADYQYLLDVLRANWHY